MSIDRKHPGIDFIFTSLSKLSVLSKKREVNTNSAQKPVYCISETTHMKLQKKVSGSWTQCFPTYLSQINTHFIYIFCNSLLCFITINCLFMQIKVTFLSIAATTFGS